MNEVWCFDSTYWGDDRLQTWVERGHSHARLFVYATGGSTAVAARALQKLGRPPTPPPPPWGKLNVRGVIDKPGAAPSVAVLKQRSDTSFATVMRSLTDIDVLIQGDPPDATSTAFGGAAGGHYECIPKYLHQLVERSHNL
jgi:hypothetical protein